jgi:carboxylesterase type B
MISENNYVTVETNYGPVKGIKKFACYGDEYFSFQKIPYMKAPIGRLRFEDPQPPETWTEPLDATSEGPSFYCRDFITGKIGGQLDALHMNVYTTNVQSIKKLQPVIVFIHGGGFASGSGLTDCYGPDYLLQEDVILVTFNYRLGIFGNFFFFINIDHEL